MSALRMNEHLGAIDSKTVRGIRADFVLTVAGQWRKTRRFRAHQQAELIGAIADTRTMFEGKGWGWRT